MGNEEKRRKIGGAKRNSARATEKENLSGQKEMREGELRWTGDAKGYEQRKRKRE